MDDSNNKPMTSPDPQSDRADLDRAAAANVLRNDIERIYNGDQAPHAEAEKEIIAELQPESSPPTSQAQALQQTQPAHLQTAEKLKHYHSSWQSYYQQYYERYYLHHLHATAGKHTQKEPEKPGMIVSDENNENNQAITELRDALLNHVKERAETVRKSRHFAPIFTAVLCAVIFLFLQYNRLLFGSVQAYVSPGNIDPQNIIVDPNANLKVGPEPKLVIPKINVDAPMVYGINPVDVSAVEDSLRKGVVHYPIANAASSPGQNGATVILGHSSNDVFDSGAYKFVFVQLNKLEKGDTFNINHDGVRYTYSVTKKEIIDPKEISKVSGDPTKPSAILITCEPPGTALKRLLVFADQISPDPAKSAAAPTKETPQASNIGGQGTTFVERLFGIR